VEGKYGELPLARLTRITEPFVLLCEGQHDSQFFTHLINVRHLPKFEVCSVNYVLGSTRGGNTKFTEALDELPAIPGFENVEKVLIVADNDLDPVAAFNGIVTAITTTSPIIGPPASRYVAPPAPLTKAGASPSVVVMMLPWTGMAGSLSTMCLAAAMNAAPAIAACVNALASCTTADTWPATTLAKMKLRALIASSHRAKPELSPAYVWSEGTNLVPLSDNVFDQVAGFMSTFPAF
jgi:hypothetical protein